MGNKMPKSPKVICQEATKNNARAKITNKLDFTSIASCTETAFSILEVSASNLEMRSPVFLPSKNSTSFFRISSKSSPLIS